MHCAKHSSKSRKKTFFSPFGSLKPLFVEIRIHFLLIPLTTERVEVTGAGHPEANEVYVRIEDWMEHILVLDVFEKDTGTP